MTADDTPPAEPAADVDVDDAAAPTTTAPLPATTAATTTTTTRTMLQRFPALLTLRWRLSLALLASVAVAVASGTVAHLIEVSDRLERDLSAQSLRVTGAIRTDLEATATALDEELAIAADPRAGVARLLGSGRVETRFLGAQARLVSGRLEVLKVLLTDGTILTSGHWPASFGALDPLISAYASEPGRLPRILDEATPAGSAPAMERWVTMRASGRELVVVAGRFLDGPALERLRARTGADLIALCQPSPSEAGLSSSAGYSPAKRGVAREDCLTSKTDALSPGRAFSPDDRVFTSRLHLDVIDVGGLSLYVGLDRSGIERVRSGIIGRAVLVGFLSVIFAVILGTLVARRVVRPIEDLADAAARVARGDLTARVVDPKTGGEVQALVDAFNLMAKDLESGQRKLLQTERVAAWQEIARGLAHELKNPLTPILSAMDVIRRARQLGRADFDEILQEQASAVVEEVMRLKELADAFARFARLPEKRPEPLMVDELIDHALALYASGIPVTRSYPAGPMPPLSADRTQLATVLTNLVKNAAEAMDTVEPDARRLGVSIAVDGGTMVIDIDDAGPGIDTDVKDRLFTPYVTTKGSRGTGLGLALSHRIIADHHGSIEAGTSPLGGARFTLRLPLTSETSSPSSSSPPAVDA